MNTALIASPEITGNIGSCTTQAIKVITGRTLWIEDIQTIATNSCTGQVTTYDTWAFTGEGGLGLAFGIMGIVLVIMVIIAWIVN